MILIPIYGETKPQAATTSAGSARSSSMPLPSGMENIQCRRFLGNRTSKRISPLLCDDPLQRKLHDTHPVGRDFLRRLLHEQWPDCTALYERSVSLQGKRSIQFLRHCLHFDLHFDQLHTTLCRHDGLLPLCSQSRTVRQGITFGFKYSDHEIENHCSIGCRHRSVRL